MHIDSFHSSADFKIDAGRYVGNSVGNVSVLKLDQETCCIEQMKYTIPFFASHGEINSFTTIFYSSLSCQ